MIPTIRRSIRTLARILGESFDSQRLGDQYGTLLAGAWSLTSDNAITDVEAHDLVQSIDWEPCRQADDVPDEQRCIQCILQHQVRVDAERSQTRTLGELLELAHFHASDIHITPELAKDTLGRHGLKPVEGGVIVSNGSKAIAAILRDTAWASCWATVLTRLPGATKSAPTWFSGAGAVSRGVTVPAASLYGQT